MTEATASERAPIGSDAAALDAVRRDVLGTSGAEGGAGILYALGVREGLIAALRHTRELDGSAPGLRRPSDAFEPLLFELTRALAPTHLFGRLRASLEARKTASVAETGCLVSAGFAAGWYSELLGEPILVREHECLARGASECRFEARAVDAWQQCDPAFAAELLPFLDFGNLRQVAARDVAQRAPAAPDPSSTGEPSFTDAVDPLSPAVHVWGPVMILPYGGSADASQALHSVLSDDECEEVCIALIDLTGARLDAMEQPGLVHLLHQLADLGMETVLVGLPESQVRTLRACGAPFADALFEREMGDAIALGFQLACPAFA